jgi:hypothetical protein
VFPRGPSNGSSVVPDASQPDRVTKIMTFRVMILRPFEQGFAAITARAEDGSARERWPAGERTLGPARP